LEAKGATAIKFENFHHDPAKLMKLPRSIVYTVTARLFAMIGPFGVGIVTARMLGPEDRGLYFFIVSLAQISAQISNFGLHASNTYVVARQPHLLTKLTINSLYVAIILTPLISVAVILIAVHPEWLWLLAPSPHRLGPEVFGAALLAPFIVAFLFVSNLAVGIGRIQLFNGLTIFSAVSALVAAGISAAVGGSSMDYIVAAALAALTSSMVGGVLLLYRQPLRLSFDKTLFREGAPLAFRAYIVTLLSFLILRVGAITLQLHTSLSEMGQFSIASQLFDGLMILPGTVGLLLFPDLVRAKDADRWTILWRVFWSLSAVMLLMVCVAGLLLPWVIPLLFGPAYSSAVPLALSFLPTVMMFCFITVISQYLSSEGYPWNQIVAWLVGFIAQTVLSYVLAAAYGALGVSLALAISTLLVLAILLREAFIVRRRALPTQEAT
jgi:O-antigen/teichoic acid export membrane protein